MVLIVAAVPSNVGRTGDTIRVSVGRAHEKWGTIVISNWSLAWAQQYTD